MKEYVINLPVAKQDTEFALRKEDVDRLKEMADNQGRSLRVYISMLLKKHVKGRK